MPKQQSETKDQELKRLRKEVAELKSVLKKDNPKSRGGIFRTIGMVLCISAAIALFIIGSIFFWAGRTVTNTDDYVKTISPLIEQPEIQDAIALKTTTVLFENVDVQSFVQDALPERAAFLAEPIATQVKNQTQSAVKKAVSSDKFQDIWVEVNTRAHERLMNTIRSDAAADGVIDINELYARISQGLEGTNLSFLANKQLPAKVGSITILKSDKLKIAHTLVTNLSLYRALAIVFSLLLFVGGIFLAKNRRRAVVAFSLITAILFTLLAVSIRVAKLATIDNIDLQYQAAASSAWRVIISSLYVQIGATILLGLVVAITAWVTGSGKNALAVRGRLSDLFAGRLHRSIFKTDPKWVVSLRKKKAFVLSFIAGLSLLYLVLAPLSFARIITAVIVSLILSAISSVVIGSDKK